MFLGSPSHHIPAQDFAAYAQNLDQQRVALAQAQEQVMLAAQQLEQQRVALAVAQARAQYQSKIALVEAAATPMPVHAPPPSFPASRPLLLLDQWFRDGSPDATPVSPRTFVPLPMPSSPAPASAATAMDAALIAEALPKPCRQGAACNKKSCRFTHPMPATTEPDPVVPSPLKIAQILTSMNLDRFLSGAWPRHGGAVFVLRHYGLNCCGMSLLLLAWLVFEERAMDV
jgi:hypothetical protein